MASEKKQNHQLLGVLLIKCFISKTLKGKCSDIKLGESKLTG